MNCLHGSDVGDLLGSFQPAKYEDASEGTFRDVAMLCGIMNKQIGVYMHRIGFLLMQHLRYTYWSLR